VDCAMIVLGPSAMRCQYHVTQVLICFVQFLDTTANYSLLFPNNKLQTTAPAG
jgi:hypothetical protein